MILNLSDISSESLQSQIIRQVRAKILNGELSAGSPLPSIRKLAREEKVSVITVQRAYEAIEREELIFSRRGKGYFVAEIGDRKKSTLAKSRLQKNLEPVIKSGLDEGIDAEEIISIIDEVLKKIKPKS